MNRFNCDHCPAQFVPQPKVERESGGNEVMYFICPACNHRYSVYRITRAGRALRDRIDGIRNILAMTPNNERLIAQRDQLLEQLQSEITDLTEKVQA